MKYRVKKWAVAVRIIVITIPWVVFRILDWLSNKSEELLEWLDECSPYKDIITWHDIEKDGYPPTSGREYDVYTHDAGYTKVVKVITYDGGNFSPIWLNDNGAEWIFPITHWRLRPAPPK